ncbi:MAG: hypothetical protein KC912_21955 [Proteobacteria bacterium]|nr:hypothetical protein [Pseudomonadota bacterium]
MTLLIENNSRQPPSLEELGLWASTYGITHPVVADNYGSVLFRYVDGTSVGLPSKTIVEAGGAIVVRDGYVSSAIVEANLPY